MYATFGLPEYSLDELVEVAKLRVQEGHTRLKMVVGAEGASSIPEDVCRVQAVREAVGDAVELMVDANHLLSLREAACLARQLEPFNIAWFEEPVHQNEPQDLAALRQRTTIPIAAGQQEAFRWNHRNLIAAGAVDIAQVDVVHVGGYTEGLKVAHLAQAYHLPLATHGWPRLNMHLVAGVANGWRVEFHALPDALDHAIFHDVPEPKDGRVELPDRPGLGLEVNEEALRQSEER